MKVQIKHSEEKTGIFKKRTFYKVTLEVQLTEEEKAVIKARNLAKDIIFERVAPATLDHDPDLPFNLTFKTLVNGVDEYTLNTPHEAKEYDDLLKEKLKLAKAYLGENTEKGEDSSFEL